MPVKFRRTACAGGLLALDGKRILMDGVSREVKPYPATPPELRKQLELDAPDALLLTHRHKDHYDEAFVARFLEKTGGPLLGPGDIPFAVSAPLELGGIRITPLKSRHIGKPDGTEHRSFLLQGSKCIWFLGDASPLLWKNRPDLPRPDVLVVPYAYGMGSGWDICRSLGAEDVVLLHLPERNSDPYGLWDSVEATAKPGEGPRLHIPAMGESVCLP